MRRPYVCFFGDEQKCRDIMNRFSAIESVYIPRDSVIHQYFKKRPMMMFAIPHKGNYMTHYYFKSALQFSLKYKTPVYVVGSRDQVLTYKYLLPGSIVYKTTLGGINKIIRDGIRFNERNRSGELALIKSHFTPVAIISDDPVYAAYCENKVSDNNRVVILSPDCKDIDNAFTIPNSYAAYVFTERRNGKIPECITELSRKGSKKGIVSIYLKTKKKAKPVGHYVYAEISKEDSTINDELRKKRKAKIRKIYREEE